MAELVKGLRNISAYSLAYYLFKVLGFIDLEVYRKKFLTKLSGKVLDIGVGDGGNYKYYKKEVNVNILDFEKQMLDYAREKISKNNLKNYKFVHANAQNLSMFKDNYFDAVVVVFIYCCSVPDSVAALKEARRVLKKNGQLIVFAHVKSKSKIISFFQIVMEPFSRFFIGSDMTRNTEEHIKEAGFKIKKEIITGGYDVFRIFIASPN